MFCEGTSVLLSVMLTPCITYRSSALLQTNIAISLKLTADAGLLFSKQIHGSVFLKKKKHLVYYFRNKFMVLFFFF